MQESSGQHDKAKFYEAPDKHEVECVTFRIWFSDLPSSEGTCRDAREPLFFEQARKTLGFTIRLFQKREPIFLLFFLILRTKLNLLKQGKLLQLLKL